MLIGLAGKAQAGKDTAANILVEKHGFERFAFADALKDVLYEVDPFIPTQNVHLSEYLEWLDDNYAEAWDLAKRDNYVRGLLQRTGQAVREWDDRYWINVVTRLIDRGSSERVVITDVRMDNEYQAVIERSGLVFRVIRDGAGVNDHVTETALDRYAMPEIDNNGSLEDLEHRVASVVSSLGGYAA